MSKMRFICFGFVVVGVLGYCLNARMATRSSDLIKVERDTTDIPARVGLAQEGSYDPYYVRVNYFPKISPSGSN
jgi:hypothetical protein